MNESSNQVSLQESPSTPSTGLPTENSAKGSGSFPYNPEQEQAIEVMDKFLKVSHEDVEERVAAADAGQDMLVLSGPAGTGKTTCVKGVLKLNKRMSIACTAPTNKAVKVLRESLGKEFSVDCATIFSLLGLRLEANGDVKELFIPEHPKSLSDYDAVVVDEAGMLGEKPYAAVVAAQKRSGIPFIFMGDEFQLPPVKEIRSKVWDIPNIVRLTKVMRHDNQILNLAVWVRERINATIHPAFLKSDYDERGGVMKLNPREFEKGIVQAAEAGLFSNGKGKVIAWRNATVNQYNQLIREIILPNAVLPYEKGDKIIAAQPLTEGKRTMMHTDDEATVLEAEEAFHPVHPMFAVIKLKVQVDSTYKREEFLYAVHPKAQLELQAELTNLAEAARKDKRKWKAYWVLADAFHQIKLAYAITAHRSQGSTYESTFVDANDVLSNPNRPEANRCFYVAATRSKRDLYLAAGV